MSLSQIFEAGGVLLRPPWETFDDAIRGLTANLVSKQQLDPALGEPAVRAICEREAAESTAIVEIGVSIPHARLAGVDGLVACFAASPTGVYFETRGLPEFMSYEPLPPHNQVFDVTDEALDAVYGEL